MSAVLRAREPSARYLETLPPPVVRQFDLVASAPEGVLRLRQLILSLAMRGKLVAQDPIDEPAGNLLDRIRAEKASLSVSKGGKRGKVAAEEIVGSYHLPSSWRWSSLATIGLVNPRSEASDDSVASFVEMSSISSVYSRPHTTEPRPWSAIRSGFTHFAEGDVGIAKITPCFENGKSTVFRNLSNGIGAGTTELHIVRPLGGVIPEYVLIFLKSSDFLREGEAVMTGSAGQKRLPRNYFEDKPFPLPPLGEQRRIVTRVNELMRLCDDLEAKGRLEAEQHARLVAVLLGTLTNSGTREELVANWQRVAAHFDLLLDRPEAVDVLEHTIDEVAVRGLLVLQRPTDEAASEFLRKIRTAQEQSSAGKSKFDTQSLLVGHDDAPLKPPTGWVWVRFGAVVTISSGVTLGRKTPIAKPVVRPYLRVANVQRWRLELSSMKDVVIDESELARFRLRAGDLLITEGGDWDKVGRTAIWRDEIGECLHQNHVFKARGLVDEWLPAWAELYLNSAVARTYFAASAKQTTNLASINMTELKACPFPLPPVAEQCRIVARISELRRVCAELRDKLTAARALQGRLADALTQEAVEGEV